MIYSNLMATSVLIDEAYNRGFNFRCNGQYAEARSEFMKVLAVDPAHVDTRHQLGLIQGFEGDFDTSLSTLAALVSQNAANLEIRYDLAMTQMMLGMFEEACANLLHILNVNPMHEKALNQAAYC